VRPILKSGFSFLAAGIVGIGSESLAAPPFSSPIPLEKGNCWNYEGKIETTLAGSATVYSTNIAWDMVIVDSMQSTNVQAAVVRGFLDELPWYEPGCVPGFCVLLNFSNRVYRLNEPDADRAAALMRAAMAQPGKFSAQTLDSDERFVLPLARDKRWGGDVERKDGWYCWHVEQEQTAKLQIKGVTEHHPFTVFSIAYRTNPDHLIVDIAPGLGITRFVYAHHGTVATVQVRLVSFEYPHSF